MTTRDSARALASYYRELFRDPLLRDFYRDTGYLNFGFWKPETADAVQACDDLVDEVLRHVPAGGAVLDVACGAGATTRRISERLRPELLVGIGLDREQLVAARARVPTAHFRRMDATRLGFRNESFDVVVCVEAAFHFATRERFFAEALRVLRPGGSLVLSDLLMARGAPLVPAANHLRSPGEYETLVTRAGFHAAIVTDATNVTWRAYRRRLTAFAVRRRYAGSLVLRDLFAANAALAWAIRHCVLVSAVKPYHSSASATVRESEKSFGDSSR